MTERQPPLLEFPCEFPIKVFGAAIPEFEQAVTSIIRQHIIELSDSSFDIRPSKNNRYHAITVTVLATSQEQLDAIYRELSSHELVIMTL